MTPPSGTEFRDTGAGKHPGCGMLSSERIQTRDARSALKVRRVTGV